MEAISNTSTGSAVSSTQTLLNTTDSSQQTKSTDSTKSTEGGSDFSAFLLKSLGRTGQDQVNEEELFSSVIGEQLNEQDPAAADFYQQKVTELSGTMARSDGYVPVEDVAKAALKATVDAGKVTKEKAETIHATAFAAAQLDDNTESLYDSRGTTAAVATMDEAMFKVKAIMDQIESGSLVLPPRDLSTPSNVGTTPGSMLGLNVAGDAIDRLLPSASAGEIAATEAGAAEGTSEKQTRFTWKHEASDGNLAILLPTRLNGNIKGVSLYDSDGNLLEKGDYSKKTGDNRTVFRFNHVGGYYGKDIDAAVTLDDGNVLVYNVNNGNERTYVPQDDFKKYTTSQWAAKLSGESTSGGSSTGSTGSSGSSGSSGASGSSGSSGSSGTSSTDSTPSTGSGDTSSNDSGFSSDSSGGSSSGDSGSSTGATA
ncbi:MAG: hypothetical protein U0136_06820 [Bdellovibrionota bacterium]